jgi:septum formation protein
MPLSPSGRFILASLSPRRLELLSLLGLPVEVMPSGIEESFLPGETPETHVLRLSCLKARAVSARHPDAWVLGADTIVLIDGEILGKPATRDEASRMLGKLSGREHTVYTGYALVRERSGILARQAVSSSVLFRELAPDEVQWYVASPEPYDKAGGYAVQGIGAFFIRAIKGSYTNVMGLPLCELVDTFKRVGMIRFENGHA